MTLPPALLTEIQAACQGFSSAHATEQRIIALVERDGVERPHFIESVFAAALLAKEAEFETKEIRVVDPDLTWRQKPSPYRKPVPSSFVSPPLEEGVEYLSLAQIQKSSGIHPVALAHRARRMGCEVVKNPSASGLMVKALDAPTIVASIRA